MIKHLSVTGTPRGTEVGEIVSLTNYSTEVVECEETGKHMVHLAPQETTKDDLLFLRYCGLTVGVPYRDDNISVDAYMKENADLTTMLFIFFAGQEVNSVDLLFTEPKMRE